MQWDMGLTLLKTNIGEDTRLCKRNHIIISTTEWM